MVIPFLKEANYIKEENLSPVKLEWLKEVIKLMQGRFKSFSQFIDYADYFFVDKIDIEPQEFKSVLNEEGISGILKEFKEELSALKCWDEKSIEDIVREIASSLQIKGGKIIHPIRVALTGKKIGPGLFELIVVLGQEKTIKRLEEAIEKLKVAETKN
jgi:glutamyl/glutaminyl-tRNA synthetase